jgi:serine/threonine protein kinase
MSRLNHPNVVTVYDLLSPSTQPKLRQYYIVMEFVPGGSVDATARKGLTWEATMKIAIGVCQGLGAAHERGIVHRDIKPGNILIGENDNYDIIKLADFGIAHLPDQQLTSGPSHPGTMLYMAPESFYRSHDRPISGQADLYSLGVTLYLLLTGKEYLDFGQCWLRAEAEIRRRNRLSPEVELSFPQQMDCQILAQQNWVETVCNEMPPDPRAYNPQLPAALSAVVMRALAKSPDQRYPNGQAMIDDLRAIRLDSHTSSATSLIVAEPGWQVNEIIGRSLEAAQQNQLSTAYELIQHAISLAPRSTRALAALANIQMMRRDFPAAVQAWLQVLEIDPTYAELYNKLGQCYNRMEQYEKAIEIQTQGLHRPENQRNALLYHGLANSYFQAGKLDEAIWALEQSLQIRPDGRLAALLENWRAQQRRN